MLSGIWTTISAVATGVCLKAKTMPYVVLADIDIASKLANDGAAGDEGSLAEANRLVDEYGAGAFNILENLGFYAVAISLVTLAIGLLLHAGDPGKVAETKRSVMPRVIGAVLLFGAVGVLTFLQATGKSLFQ